MSEDKPYTSSLAEPHLSLEDRVRQYDAEDEPVCGLVIEQRNIALRDLETALARIKELESTITKVRAELNEAFDDIDRDCEGNLNDLDCMVMIAGYELKWARSWATSETERANKAEHRISQLRSRVNLEMARTATSEETP